MRTIKSTKLALLLNSTCLIFLVILGIAAASASAEAPKPWWHLSSVTRPSYLQPGQARDSVYRLTVNASSGTFKLEDQGVGDVAEGESTVTEEVQVGATPAELQAALDGEGVFGPGNVEVTSPCTTQPTAACSKTVNPYEIYEIRFVGGLADRPVGMEIKQEYQETVFGGGSEVKLHELDEGRPDGYIVVQATNLGDAPANPATDPITLADVLPNGLEAIGIEGTADENFGQQRGHSAQMKCELGLLSCTFTGLYPGVGYENRYPPIVPPYFRVQMRIAVNFKAGASVSGEDQASVVGGEAAGVTVKRPLRLSSAAMPFGVSSFELLPEEVGGGLDTQAGSHPYQLTTTLAFNQRANGSPVALAKDLSVKLPPGLIGNPTPLPRCSLADFYSNSEPECPDDTAVGVAVTTIRVPVALGAGVHWYFPFQTAVYNLEPGAGEPARFGFDVEAGGKKVLVLLNAGVRTGSDYGVTVSSSNISEVAELSESELTFWGVPGDPSHDGQRGGCVELEARRARNGEEPCSAAGVANPAPLLSMPTTCVTDPATGAPQPLQAFLEGDSWAAPGTPAEAQGSLATTVPMGALAGCDLDLRRFDPSIGVRADVAEASKPSGLSVDVHVPQEEQLNPDGIAESNVKNIEVTLPAGVTLNPSAANGLEACSGDPAEEAQSPGNEIGYTGARELETVPGVSTQTFTPRLPGSVDALEADESASLAPGSNFCPNASKIGEATIKTPLLPENQPLKGFVYLASPQNFSVLSGFPQENPFYRHVAMYIVAEDSISGSLVKLPGKVELGGEPGVEGLAEGQIRTTFEDNPQLAFEDAELKFFGGERAPLATPSHCGSYTTNAVFTPWAAEPSDEALVKVSSSSKFEITSGPGGSACPGSSLPFSPSLASGTTNNDAGGFSPLTTTLSRPDGDQGIQSVTLHYPAGLSGLLSSVKLCGEAEASAGTCGPQSQIGEAIVSVGVGGDPFTVTGGKVYITGPYHGAPFGLSIATPAKAGPFDLQEGRPVVVRAKIEVNPYTTALTITTNPSMPGAIPTILEGFPLQLQHVNVLINRPGFTFNPTSCAPTKITGLLNSAEGASAPVEVPFQATNCASLKFAPKFSVSTSGKTSKAYGASLTTRVVEPEEPQGSQANISTVKVELPKALPSRLTTLQKACIAAQFNANPAGCPSESMVGHAKVVTSLLPVPLEGPAILVSHGGEAFPALTMVLQGYGVTIDLVGTTFISKAGITSTTFKKTIDDQPFNTFELTLPEGKYSALAALGNLCTQKLTMPNEFVGQNGATIRQNTPISVTGCAKTKTLTRAQKLAKALRACKKKAKGKRAVCDAKARKQFGAVKIKKKQKGK